MTSGYKHIFEVVPGLRELVTPYKPHLLAQEDLRRLQAEIRTDLEYNEDLSDFEASLVHEDAYYFHTGEDITRRTYLRGFYEAVRILGPFIDKAVLDKAKLDAMESNKTNISTNMDDNTSTGGEI